MMFFEILFPKLIQPHLLMKEKKTLLQSPIIMQLCPGQEVQPY